MTVYIHAPRIPDAEAWAREQRIPLRDVRAFGERTSAVGLMYRPGDRLVVLGNLSRRTALVVDVNNRKVGNLPVERYPWPPDPAAVLLTSHLSICLACSIERPFTDIAERDGWSSEHQDATGHPVRHLTEHAWHDPA